MTMPGEVQEGGAAAEQRIVLAYAPAAARAGLAALLALDDALAMLLRTTREPAVGQMRLAWWRESLEQLDVAPPPAQPVLEGLARAVLPQGLTGASLVPIVHGWEVLVEEDALAADALRRFGEGRARLFTAAGTLLGAEGDPLAEAGPGWALADLALHLRDAGEAAEARAQASRALEVALARRWSRRGRALGALAHLARIDLRHTGPVAHGAPGRVGRLLWHRLSGR
jgi:15-cis-phytoene synthase